MFREKKVVGQKALYQFACRRSNDGKTKTVVMRPIRHSILETHVQSGREWLDPENEFPSKEVKGDDRVQRLKNWMQTVVQTNHLDPQNYPAQTEELNGKDDAGDKIMKEWLMQSSISQVVNSPLNDQGEKTKGVTHERRTQPIQRTLSQGSTPCIGWTIEPRRQNYGRTRNIYKIKIIM